MECIANAFSLAVEHADVIRNAMSIYRSWLNIDNADNRPEVIGLDEEFYRGEILMHMSLLFDRKTHDHAGRHSELCKNALAIYRDLVRNKPLSEATWNILLKLLLIIVPKQYSKESDFYQLLYATLFEIWIRSNTRDQTLWTELEGICKSDELNEWLIYQWSSLAKALTRRVVRIVYGNDKGFVDLKFKTTVAHDRNTVAVVLPYEQVLYFWFRVLHLPLSLKSLPRDPTIHSELCLAIDKIVGCFLLVCNFRFEKNFRMPDFDIDQKIPALTTMVRGSYNQHAEYFARQRRLPIPSADALLDLLGPWLFKNATTESSYFEKGQAFSARTLCKIVSQAAGPVKDEHLKRFYGVFLRAFDSKADLVTTEILVNSQNLFILDHKGVRSMITYEAVAKALSHNISENKSLELQLACVNIAASVAALPLFYSGHSVLQKHYKHLGDQLEIIFNRMIRTEKKPEIFKKIIWSACVFCASAGDIKPVDKLIEAMLTKLQALDLPPDREMYLELLRVIATLPFLIAPRGFTTSKDLATRVLLTLSSLIANKLTPLQTDNKLIHLYFTILHWLSCFPQVAEDENSRRQIMSIMKEGFDQSNHKPAQYALRRIQHILGREMSPIKVGSNLFIHFAPSSQLLRRPDLQIAGKYFMLGKDVLVSLFDTEGDHEEVLMLIRDMFGRYVWKAQLIYRSNKQPPSDTSLKVRSNDGPKPLARPPSSSRTDEELMTGLTDSVMQIHSQVVSFMRAQEQTEQQFLNSTTKKEFTGPSTFFTTERVPKAHRLFLAQLGFLTTKSLSKIMALEHDEIAGLVQNLDSLNEREIFVLPLIYLHNVESTPVEVMTNTDDYTSDFHEFLKTLGVPITPDNRTNLFENLEETIQRYGCALYNSGYHFELLTVTPALMPESKLTNLKLSAFVYRREVVVIWNARRTDPITLKKPSVLISHDLEGKIVIMITPLINKLYKVNISKECGPLLDNVLIPLPLLAPLLVRTVLNLHANRSQSVLEAVHNRKKILTQVYETGAKLQDSLPNFSSLFSYAFAH